MWHAFFSAVTLFMIIAVPVAVATLVARLIISGIVGLLPDAEGAKGPSIKGKITTLMLLLAAAIAPASAFADATHNHDDTGCGGSASSSSSTNFDWGDIFPQPKTTAVANDEVSDDDTVLGCGKARHSNFTMMMALLAAVVSTLLIARLLNKKPPNPRPPDSNRAVNWSRGHMRNTLCPGPFLFLPLY